MRYVQIFVHVLGWKAALAIAVALLGSLLDIVGVLLMLPILQSVGVGVHAGGVGSLADHVFSVMRAAGIQPSLASALVLYVSLSAIRAFVDRAQTVLGGQLASTFVWRLRERLYLALGRADWLFLVRNRSSDFVHALTSDIDRVGTATPLLSTVVTNIVVGVLYLVLALRVSVPLTAFALGGAAMLVLVTRGTALVANDVGEQISASTSRLYGMAMEHLAAMKITRLFGAQERHSAEFSAIAERVAMLHVEAIRAPSNAKVALDVGSAAMLAGAIYLAIKLIAVPLAGVFLLLVVFSRLVPRVTAMQNLAQYIAGILPSFGNVMAVIDRCEAAAEALPDRSVTMMLHTGVALDGVSFAYRGDGDEAYPTLRDVSIAIPVGHTVAIVGPSGSGKSTVADIFAGLLTPDRGSLRVDDRHVEPGAAESWRSEVGYVGQDPFLFNDTVRNNLLWAAPKASEDDVWEALRQASAGFVEQLSNGLDTTVGDRGVQLSGGERQRLSLARALLCKPSLLILDEATSSVDSENERQILAAIDALHGSMTILMIAHRLSTVRSADRIYVIEAGRVVESGRWDELVAMMDGRFQALFHAQNLERPVAFAARADS